MTIRNALQAHDQETIVALCSPRGPGAIAILRLSGKDAFSVTDAFSKLSSRASICQVPSHTINHGYVIDQATMETVIDEVMFLVMDAPRTFTGQPTVEITCHNNPFIIEKIIALAIQHGARMAQHGEFARRAFLNGKIDLVQAEAINEVIHAQTELALRTSMAQLQGSLSHFLSALEERLILLLCTVEASFEFLDEEQRDLAFDSTIKNELTHIAIDVKKALSSYNQQQQIKNGIRIALCGSVNAGKSTLFNALLGHERAIVAEIAGTTRDSIESSVYKNGTFMLFVDTAGLRQTNDVIEQRGIDRTHIEAAQADIIVLVVDVSSKQSCEQDSVCNDLIERYKDKCILVLNKIDQALGAHQPEINWFTSPLPQVKLSAHTKVGIELLEKAIEEKIQTLFKTLQSPFLLNQRQHNVLTEINKKIDFIVTDGQRALHYELVAYHLKEILEILAQATGKTITERLLDSIFSTFCVGK